MNTKTVIDYLKSKGYGKEEIKLKCGIHKNTYIDWDKNNAEMRFKTAIHIFTTLNLSFREFLRINNIK